MFGRHVRQRVVCDIEWPIKFFLSLGFLDVEDLVHVDLWWHKFVEGDDVIVLHKLVELSLLQRLCLQQVDLVQLLFFIGGSRVFYLSFELGS